MQISSLPSESLQNFGILLGVSEKMGIPPWVPEAFQGSRDESCEGNIQGGGGIA